MNNSTRRKFLRNSSIAATGLVLATPSGAKIATNRRKAIACAPGSVTQLFGTIASVKSGNWSDPSTWGGRTPGEGDTPVISAGHSVTHDQERSIVSGVNVNSGGTLQFDPNKSTSLLSSRNIVVYGRLVMKPSSASNTQFIQFININENNFIGSGHDIIEGDIGLWVMGAGQLDISGARKKCWTRATGSVNRGATSFSVQDASSWNVGDTIFIVPTDMPGPNTYDWDDNLRASTDSFAVKFERRIISGVSGNTVQLDKALNYDHIAVSTDTGKTWTAEVGNITRNVRIEGTEKGRAHIFIRSSMPQSIYYMAGRFLGPRKGGGRTSLVSGRYGLHFHHCVEGSRGSMVEGCAISDTGNRAYVPHMSHGVTMNNNIAFSVMEASFWWDFQELSHDTSWDGNLTAYVKWNGMENGTRGMEMNMGDGNSAKNNVVVYAHCGDEHQQGGYVWNADSEGVWIFENNLSHSNRSGLFVWQNTGNNHTIVNHESYNDNLGIFHGAYINSYTYTGGYFHNSLVRVKATSGNASGVRFEKVTFDGAGKLPYVVEVYPSPVTSGGDYNAFRECNFKGYSDVGLMMNTFSLPGENGKKHASLIKCNFSGRQVGFLSSSIYGSQVFVQPAAGDPSVVNQSGISRVARFAPTVYGTGRGLKGEYFNGSNHEKLAFTRIDSMIMFGQWTYDKGASPTQVHYKITSANYSMRWTGQIEAQFSETHTFKVSGSGGFRMWLNDEQIIDSWVDRADNEDIVTSKPVALQLGQRYNVKLEHMNLGGARSCHFFWECPSFGRKVHVSQSQMYTDATVVPRPPVQNQVPVANAGEDIILTLPVNSTILNGTKSSDSDGQINSYNWSKVNGPAKATILNSNQAQTELKELEEGVYVFRLRVTDDKGGVHEDDVQVTVKAGNQSPVASAGPDINIILPVSSTKLDGSQSKDPEGKITKYSWTKTSGPASCTLAKPAEAASDVTNLVAGIYTFKLTVTDEKGSEHTDDVIVNVKSAGNQSPVASAGPDITLTLPVNKTTLSGTASKDADGTIASYKWSKVSGPATATIVSSTESTTELKDLTQGVYVFRLQVIDNVGAAHEDEVVVNVNAATPGNQSPVANAGEDLTVTLPVNTATLDGRASRDPDGTITSYKWLMVNGPAEFSFSNQNNSFTTVNNLVAGVYTFRLMVTDDKGAIHNDDVQVTVNPAKTAGNQAPIANAGPDIYITLPTNRTVLDGSASKDSDGSITSYRWSKVSGPATYNISKNNVVTTKLEDLREGVYVFRLAVTDEKGAIHTDDITVTVSRQGAPEPTNQAPVARAGQDVVINLPVNKVVVDGGGSSDTDGFIANYKWSRVSGPSQYTIVRSDNAVTEINGLVQGVYVFRLTVTDDKGLTNTDDISVTVLPATQQPQQPEQPQQPVTGLTVNAGTDIVVTLPKNDTILLGTATGGVIVSYKWTKVSGPATYNIYSNSAPSTMLQDLRAGTYVFRLTVTDNKGKTAYDDVTVTVGYSLARIEQPTTLNAAVWPNPSSSMFNLNLLSGSEDPITLKIHNQWGQVVKLINGAKNNSTMLIGEGLSKGQYFLIVEQGTQKKIIKIIKL
ncbi:PKD domain-containing protein [Flavitalea sp.]|nr:PKD domain-containing protein [Flavitalea sp.]